MANRADTIDVAILAKKYSISIFISYCSLYCRQDYILVLQLSHKLLLAPLLPILYIGVAKSIAQTIVVNTFVPFFCKNVQNPPQTSNAVNKFRSGLYCFVLRLFCSRNCASFPCKHPLKCKFVAMDQKLAPLANFKQLYLKYQTVS